MKPGFKDFVLEPETMAEAVVQQVLSGYGALLILPARLGMFSGVRGFPSWIQEGMRNSVNQDLKSWLQANLIHAGFRVSILDYPMHPTAAVNGWGFQSTRHRCEGLQLEKVM